MSLPKNKIKTVILRIVMHTQPTETTVEAGIQGHESAEEEAGAVVPENDIEIAEGEVDNYEIEFQH